MHLFVVCRKCIKGWKGTRLRSYFDRNFGNYPNEPQTKLLQSDSCWDATTPDNYIVEWSNLEKKIGPAVKIYHGILEHNAASNSSQQTKGRPTSPQGAGSGILGKEQGQLSKKVFHVLNCTICTVFRQYPHFRLYGRNHLNNLSL